MRNRCFVLLALFCAMPHVLSAQSSTVGISGGYARPANEKDSGSISLSYALQSRWFRVQGIGDILLSANESNYYYDSFDNGDGRCRNGDNGQFADSSLCGPATDLGLRGEVALRIPGTGLSLGPGFRVDEDQSAPYGFAQYEAPVQTGSRTHWLVRGSGGQNYIQAEVGIAFGLGSKGATP